MMSIGTVKCEIKNGIATISFFHPQSNSLPGSLLRSLTAEIDNASANPDAKVIILKSEGEKVFCAGASFDELTSITTLEEGKYFFSGFASLINAMRKSPKFILARVQGKAVGGGVGVACAADYTFAHQSASVKLSELAVGIGPFVVGPAVERKIGVASFATLSINASEWCSAEWAKEKSMYSEIYSTISELDEALNKLARKLAESNPEAMSQLKRILWKDTDHWESLLMQRAEISGKLVLSEFTRDAIAKFKSGTR